MSSLRQLAAYSDFLREFTDEMEKIAIKEMQQKTQKPVRFDELQSSEKFADLLNFPNNYDLHLMTTISQYFMDSSEYINANYLRGKKTVIERNKDAKEIKADNEDDSDKDSSTANGKKEIKPEPEAGNEVNSKQKQKSILDNVDFSKFEMVSKNITIQLQELPAPENDLNNNSRWPQNEAKTETASKKTGKDSVGSGSEYEAMESDDTSSITQIERINEEGENKKSPMKKLEDVTSNKKPQSTAGSEKSKFDRDLIAVISDF